MNVLLLHAMPHRFPERIRTAHEIEHLSVLVQPEHAGHYDPDTVDIELVSNTTDPAQVHAGALAVMRRRRIDRIVSPFEFTIPAAAYLRECLGLPGIGFSTAVKFTHKNVMKAELAAAGLPVAPYRIGHTLDDIPGFGWPVVVKPAVGGGCIDVTALHGPNDLARLDTAHLLDSPLVIEKLLDVTGEYHCEGVVHGGEVRFTAVSRYLQPILSRRDNPGLSGSYCLPSSDPAGKAVVELHDEAVGVLGLDSGVTHLEVLDTPAGFVIGEITCRIGGGGITQNVQNQYGVDLWREWLLLSLGREPELSLEPKEGIHAYYQLPVRSGPFTGIVDTNRFLSMESVLSVEAHLNPGDVVPARRSASLTPTTVYLRVDDEAELAEQIGHLTELASSCSPT